MSQTVIADTGVIVAYLDPSEQHHAWAVEQFERFPSFLTCEAVLSESCFLASRQQGGAARVMGLLTSGVLDIAYHVTRNETHRLRQLIEQYADQPMSFADACLVRMSEQHRAAEVITTDSDFRVYRRSGNQEIPATLP